MLTKKIYQSYKAGVFYYRLILLFFPFGLLLYNFLSVQLIDEVCVLCLLFYWIKRKGITKELLILGAISFFYLSYSILINTNGYIAPLYDLQQAIKPYIVILATLSLKPTFSEKQRRKIKKNVIFYALILFVIYLFGETGMYATLGHPASAAIMSFTLGIYYLYFSEKKKRDIRITITIILCGILSFKFKLYGECIVFFIIYFLLKQKILKLNFKYLLFFAFTVCITLALTWSQFNKYYVNGLNEDSGLARPLMYITAGRILLDYIPFGSGLGSFANEASRVFYSPIYYKYDIYKVWGISPEDNGVFVADAFFPVLAQFGIFGILLFYIFWKHIYNKTKRINNLNDYKIALILLGTLFIESVADSSMLSNRGILIMILLGLCCNNTTTIKN